MTALGASEHDQNSSGLWTRGLVFWSAAIAPTATGMALNRELAHPLMSTTARSHKTSFELVQAHVAPTASQRRDGR